MKTRFNLTRQHVINIRTLLNGYTDGAVVVPGKDIVIIHGSGQMFACNDNELVKSRDDDGRIIIIPAALAGSNHHKQYNSGYDQSREAAGVAAYRAIYRKGDKLPESVVDIENKMTDQAFADIKIGLAKPEFE